MSAHAAASESAPPALHNMSGRPRTEVTVSTPSVDDVVVSFSLDGMGSKIGRLQQRRWTTVERRRVAELVLRLDGAKLTAQLDEAWEAMALDGAALLWSGGQERDCPSCAEPLLALNVLSRSRDNLLLAESDPVLAKATLARRLFTDDPRLTSLVVGPGGARS
ncbi:MAG: hypothetical protein M5T61_03180 [Acidimicrobiia bacterium]|nr:hypothetical protein [Acidimicrobiia bacterium]